MSRKEKGKYSLFKGNSPKASSASTIPMSLFYWGDVKGAISKNSASKTDISDPIEIERNDPSKGVISLSTKGNHMLAITEDFTLFGCGDNSSKQIFPFGSKGTETADLKNLIPVSLGTNNLKVVQVSCGKDFTAYLTSIGRIYTFGSNSYGQLGHGSDRSSEHSGPRMVQGIPHEKCIQVATGDYSTYALTQHGKVFATGCGKNGRLGITDLCKYKLKTVDAQKLPQPSPFLVELIKDRNYNVDKTLLERNAIEMTQVNGALLGNPVVCLSAGSGHCLAVSASGKVYGWGCNSYGQLGLKSPSFSGSLERNAKNIVYEIDSDDESDSTNLDGVVVPTILDIEDVSECSAGARHSLFITDSRKSLYASGSNINGQLGPISVKGDKVEKIVKVDVRKAAAENFGIISKVSCGSNHSAVLLDSGSALIFGKQTDVNTSDKIHVERISKNVQKVANSQLFDIECGNDLTFAMVSPDFVSLIKQNIKRKEILKTQKPIGITMDDVVAKKSNMVYRLRKLLLDIGTLNASFLLPEEERKKRELLLSKNGSTEVGDSSFVDVDGIVKSMQVFTELIKDDKDKLRARQLIASVVAKLDFSAENVTEPDQLRAYFILCISPLLQSITPSEHEMLMVSIFKLPVASRRRFFSWIINDLANENINLVLDLLVKPLLNQLDVHIMRKKYTVQAVYLCKFLHVLYLICMRTNEINEQKFDAPQIPSAAFYTKALDGFSDQELEMMYKKWSAVVLNRSEMSNGPRQVPRNGMNTLFPMGPFMGMMPNQMQDEPEGLRRQDSEKSVEDIGYKVEGATFGLSGLGETFMAIVDNTLEDTLNKVSPDLVMFKHPFLMSANMKRRFMQIDDRLTQINNYIRFFASGIEPNFLLKVRRGQEMIHDTFDQLREMRNKPSILLKRPLKVKFSNEDGLDAGGVKKEFFLLLSADLFSPDFRGFSVIGKTNCLWFQNSISPFNFKGGDNESITYEDYQEAVQRELHTDDLFGTLEIIGTVMALAVYNDTLLDVQFPKAMYQLLLNQLPTENLTLANYKKFDPDSANNLEFIMNIENPEELEALDLRFECTQEAYGVAKEIEICKKGSEKVVTMANREEYVKAYITFQMYSPLIKKKAEALTKGFSKVINAEQAALSLFHPDELELLLVGTPELDFSLLKANSEYEGGFNANHAAVQKFWEIVENLDYEKRKLFLKFCTGSSRAPVGGLKNVKFKLQRAGPDSNQLPTSHTCFNTLMLPDYSSKKKMERLLLLAIENSEGFGLQ